MNIYFIILIVITLIGLPTIIFLKILNHISTKNYELLKAHVISIKPNTEYLNFSTEFLSGYWVILSFQYKNKFYTKIEGPKYNISFKPDDYIEIMYNPENSNIIIKNVSNKNIKNTILRTLYISFSTIALFVLMPLQKEGFILCWSYILNLIPIIIFVQHLI